MSRKSIGITAERELIHKFWKNKWASCRVAGSGSIKYPVPDLLASNNLRVLAIEVKSTKENYQYLTKKEIKELKEFSRILVSIALIALESTSKSPRSES